MDINILLTFLTCIFFLFLLGKVFALPIKNIFKLMLNSAIGGFSIYIINLIGTNWNFHIGLNIVTSIFIGILGLPGAILLIIMKLIF